MTCPSQDKDGALLSYLEGFLWDDAFQLLANMNEREKTLQIFRSHVLAGKNN